MVAFIAVKGSIRSVPHNIKTWKSKFSQHCHHIYHSIFINPWPSFWSHASNDHLPPTTGCGGNGRLRDVPSFCSGRKQEVFQSKVSDWTVGSLGCARNMNCFVNNSLRSKRDLTFDQTDRDKEDHHICIVKDTCRPVLGSSAASVEYVEVNFPYF